jgi:23S rRNA (cytosine1962-C5)-methyltransferase
MSLRQELLRALARRRELLARLHAEGTDAYRLFHGIAEGVPGVTIDRYGPCLLVQTFRAALPAPTIAEAQRQVRDELGLELLAVHNHRGPPPPPDQPTHQAAPAALADHVFHERGLRFRFRARHRGQDPWLFLDLRAARAFVQAHAAGRRVLNLFAYTGGVGVAAAAGGAASVLDVDFARSALAIATANAADNGVADRCRQLRADCLPILRQLAGMPVQRRGRRVPYVRIERQPFDLIVLDPPRFARTPFGAIDVVRDYQTLWKPALLALAPGGMLVATNHAPEVREEDWHAALRRAAQKAGRPLRALTSLPVDADFPSFDGRPPLKVVVAEP